MCDILLKTLEILNEFDILISMFLVPQYYISWELMMPGHWSGIGFKLS